MSISVAQIERRQVKSGGTQVYYQVTGAGEPLVLVHGLSGSTRWWDKNIGPLAKHFRVYAIDLLRFGDGTARPKFVLREAAKNLLALLDDVGLERAHFIGHSMGGLIVSELAAEHQARVGRLILVNAASLPFGRNLPRLAMGSVRTFFRLPLGFLPVLVQDAHRTGVLPILKTAREIITTDITEKVGHVAAPTLIIWGEHDHMLPLAIGEQLLETIPDARLIVIPRAGHNPMWDRPEEFNRAVISFAAAESVV
jgi:pimeloyl-ACP methyl ester carboxylesterase